MKIRNVVHKELRRFIEDGDGSALPAALLPKVAKIVSFLQDMPEESELRAVPIGYISDLRRMTKGGASFTMQFHHYDPVPRNIAEEIMAKSA